VNPYIHTYYGHRVHFLRPKPSEIDIRDIAHALCRIPRFNGHTHIPYYVANHLCLCYDNAPQEIKREAFSHDFSESVACDIPSPLKSLMPQYKEIERRLEKVIARKFKLRYPWPAAVKEIDMRMLCSEMRDLTGYEGWSELPFVPFEEKIIPWDSATCKREFIKRCRKLGLI